MFPLVVLLLLMFVVADCWMMLEFEDLSSNLGLKVDVGLSDYFLDKLKKLKSVAGLFHFNSLSVNSLTPFAYYGVLTLPLGDWICIFYLCPLFTVYIAHFWLKEELPNCCILVPSTTLTVLGVLMVSQFDGDVDWDGSPSMVLCDFADPHRLRNPLAAVRNDGVDADRLRLRPDGHRIELFLVVPARGR